MFQIGLGLRSAIRQSAVLFAVCALTTGAFATTTTLKNMEAAFNGERNAVARYSAFAKQAEAEGYGEVSSLFRAAARAEEIHATKHAEVIQQLGGDPQARIDQPEVKSTRENLEAAIKGETYERDTVYPEFIQQARSDHDAAAVKSLNLAKTAEAEHATLYAAALANLKHLKGSRSFTFWVCPNCGFTVREVDFSKCPSCFTPKEKFEQVS